MAHQRDGKIDGNEVSLRLIHHIMKMAKKIK
jgi:hypothetical protein